MKRNIIFVLLITQSYILLGQDFRLVTWGMTKAQVLKTEKSKLISSNEDKIVFEGVWANMDVDIIYEFANDLLFSGMYMFHTKHTNENDYIDDFVRIKDLFLAKYDKPYNDQKEWKNDLYRDDPSKWGFAISVGHLNYKSEWMNQESSIQLLMTGDNFHISMAAVYESTLYAQRAKKFKEKERLKELFPENKTSSNNSNPNISQKESVVFKDSRNNEDYKVVKIGYQFWIAKNLNVDRYGNGDLIPQVEEIERWKNLKTGAWCYSKKRNAQGTFDRLYNGYAVIDPRGLAPMGWHIPTEEEWKELENQIGKAIPKLIDQSGGIVDIDKTLNQTGFSALPISPRTAEGTFPESSGFFTTWWSSTKDDSENYLHSYCIGSTHGFISAGRLNLGSTVRCLRD